MHARGHAGDHSLCYSSDASKVDMCSTPDKKKMVSRSCRPRTVILPTVITRRVRKLNATKFTLTYAQDRHKIRNVWPCGLEQLQNKCDACKKTGAGAGDDRWVGKAGEERSAELQ